MGGRGAHGPASLSTLVVLMRAPGIARKDLQAPHNGFAILMRR
jgi:hypothetical protein